VSETGQKSSVAPRPSWGQLAIMFASSIPVVAIAAGAATAVAFVVDTRSWGWYVLVVPLSPGWLLPSLLASLLVGSVVGPTLAPQARPTT
jgi:hypothetical protein